MIKIGHGVGEPDAKLWQEIRLHAESPAQNNDCKRRPNHSTVILPSEVNNTNRCLFFLFTKPTDICVQHDIPTGTIENNKTKIRV